MSVARTFLDLTDRRLDRIATQLPVEFGSDGKEFKRDYSVNLSPGGVFVATQAVMPVDTTLSLRFQFPDNGRRLACRGRVAWLNHAAADKKPHLPTGMGIQFASLAEEQLNIVRGYLAGSMT
ncbi:MAG: TIGR02266 family protein [Deltaproteobacteria bacterium]|nr:TIGR02266 family protein [Deltaproteobacteria bacterium]